MPEHRTIIVGAGLAGLSCAHALGRGSIVLEKEGRVGGLCRTENTRGFTADLTGHYLHFAEKTSRGLVMGLLRRNILERERNSRVHLRGREGPYPFQGNVAGHEREVVRDCVVGLFRALEGGGTGPGRGTESYSSWVLRTQGKGFARHFMFPFNYKQFRTRMNRLTVEQGGRFAPRPRPEDVVRGALGRGRRATGYNSRLWYPRHGGIESLPRALAARLNTAPVLGVEVAKIRWRERQVLIRGRAPLSYDTLVYTGPLPELLSRLEPLPEAMAVAGRGMKWIGILTVHFFMRRKPARDIHWVYVPEKRYIFYRYGYPSNINAGLAPSGRGLLSAEISYLPGRRPDKARVAKRALAQLRRLGAVDEVTGHLVTDVPFGYVLFDPRYRLVRTAAMRFLARNRIMSIGRYGGWTYGGMSDAIREGLDAGALIAVKGSRSAGLWLKRSTS